MQPKNSAANVVAAVVLALGLVGALHVAAPSSGTVSFLSGPACTYYVAPAAVGAGTGASAGNAATFNSTNVGVNASLTLPAVVCLEAGTYTLASAFHPRVGTDASHTITWEPDGSAAVRMNWNGGAWSAGGDFFMWHLCPTSGCTSAHAGIWTTIGCGGTWTWDGSNNGSDTTGSTQAVAAIFDAWGDHLSVTGCTFQYVGGGAVSTIHSDYLTASGNTVWLNGYAVFSSGSDPSGISFNTDYNSDSTTNVFHNFILNNVVGGQQDAYVCGSPSCPTDGNGIILDLMSTGTGNNTTENTGGPPTLVANNLVYMAGGRCIHAFANSNVYVVNNTCYKNALNTAESAIGDFSCGFCTDSYWVDNTAWSWPDGTVSTASATQRQPYHYDVCNTNCDAATDAGNIWRADAYYDYGSTSGACGGPNTHCVPAGQVGNLTALAPLYSAPIVSDSGAGLMAGAPSPFALGTKFQIATGDPLVGAGVDPATLSAVLPLASLLDTYVGTDLAGTARPSALGWDIGAYEAIPPPATPTPASGVHTRPHLGPRPR